MAKCFCVVRVKKLKLEDSDGEASHTPSVCGGVLGGAGTPKKREVESRREG